VYRFLAMIYPFLNASLIERFSHKSWTRFQGAGQLPAGKVITRPISQIDIMPTLFEMLGMSAPDFMEGSSLLPLIRDGSADFREENYAQTTPAGWQALADDDREIYCVRTKLWKLVMHTDARRSAMRYELFDLANDPGETRDVFEDRSDIVSELLPKLEDYSRGSSGRLGK